MAIRETTKVKPINAVCHSNLCAIVSTMGDLMEGEKKAINLDPSNVDDHQNLGKLLKDRRDLAGAEKE